MSVARAPQIRALWPVIVTIGLLYMRLGKEQLHVQRRLPGSTAITHELHLAPDVLNILLLDFFSHYFT
jgi:hypothetical protein